MIGLIGFIGAYIGFLGFGAFKASLSYGDDHGNTLLLVCFGIPQALLSHPLLRWRSWLCGVYRCFVFQTLKQGSFAKNATLFGGGLHEDVLNPRIQVVKDLCEKV